MAKDDDLRVKLCPDGTYRWIYELNMLKNPTVLFTVYKVLAISFLIVALMGLAINACSGNLTIAYGREDILPMCLFILGVLALGLMGYLVVAAGYGWKYIILFEMDEEGVIHRQLPKTMKKAKAIGMLQALSGIVAGNPGSVAMGIYVSKKDMLATSFGAVRKVRTVRMFDLIKVNEPFANNMIYVGKEDYDFVLDYIKSRCPRLKDNHQ